MRLVFVLAVIIALNIIGADRAHSCNPFVERCGPFNSESKSEAGTK